jgi:DNA polymerase-3 subunit alpha
MLKMDFLGLTTLTVIKDALDAIEQRTGQRPDLQGQSDDDPEVYRMLRAGRTTGVFQFESPLATDMLRAMRCDRFDDLVASNALMRPGPLDAGMHRVYQKRKRGEEPVVYALPELEPILEPTYGVITYQEQVMRIAQVLAGISLAEADVLRKAVGKKDAELIKQELGKFIAKAVARGYEKRVIDDLAGQIETFGRYGFNKSHSVAYSIISYHTAWLKAHYPAEFMAALLSSSIGDTDSVVKFINEARELGIEVLAPDVNESGYKFTVIGEKRIRFGLGAIRNVGKAAIDSMLSARAEKPLTSLFDLCERVDLRLCNKRVFEALIYSGAVDGLGGHRSQYIAVLDAAIQEASLKQQEIETGQGSLFGGLGTGDSGLGTPNGSGPRGHVALPNIAPMSEAERLTKEKEILGFYISGHPLEPYRTESELFATHTVSQLGKWVDGIMTLGVVVTAVKRQVSKRSGAEFARLTVEDFSGSSEVLVFPENWSVLSDRIRTDLPLLVRGAYSRRDQGTENPTFIIESVQRFEELRIAGQVTIAIDLSAGSGKREAGNGGTTEALSISPQVMQDVRAVAEAHPGAAPLEIRWDDGDGTQARLRSRSIKLSATNAALTELRALLGQERVRLVRGS